MSSRGRSAYRGRFAPSPTGALHFGSLVAAVGSWLRANSQGGVWLLRIEDLDPPREIPGAAVEMINTLAAFGMVSDEPIEYQSARGDLYQQALDQLIVADLAFACRCSRSELAAEGIHRGCTAGNNSSRDPAWRVRAPDCDVTFVDLVQGHQAQNLAHEVGDFVVRRIEGWFAYQLAVVVDDAAQGITEIVRGADLIDSTARQIHLQRLLGLPTPKYVHLPIALGPGGRKLSKQSGSIAVDGSDPLPALIAALAFLGFEVSRFSGLRTPDAVLALACASFELQRLPGVHSLPAPAAAE